MLIEPFEEILIDQLEDTSPAGFYNLCLHTDDGFNYHLDQLHTRIIESQANVLLTEFETTFYMLTEELISNPEPVEAVNVLTDLLNEVYYNFDYFYNCLNVNCKDELKLLTKLLKESYNLLFEGVENKEVEYIIESYYNLKFKLTNWGLLIQNPKKLTL